MKKLLAIAFLFSVGVANAETSLPIPVPTQAPNPPMVRNIGIAEQGDAIVVRKRKEQAVPEAKDAPK